MELGKWYLTAGANAFLENEENEELVGKFLSKDWGDTHEEDKEMNNEALETKDRIVAKYIVRDTDIFIIREYGHEVTTILLASEY